MYLQVIKISPRFRQIILKNCNCLALSTFHSHTHYIVYLVKHESFQFISHFGDMLLFFYAIFLGMR